MPEIPRGMREVSRHASLKYKYCMATGLRRDVKLRLQLGRLNLVGEVNKVMPLQERTQLTLTAPPVIGFALRATLNLENLVITGLRIATRTRTAK